MSTSKTFTVELEEEALNIGIQSTGRDISTRFGLDETTINAHIGQWDGQGPRYGMAPIPNHNHSESVLGNLKLPYGLQQTESAFLWGRTRVIGVIPLSVISKATPTTTQTVFFWAVVGDGRLLFTHGALYSTFIVNGATHYAHAPQEFMNSPIATPLVYASASSLIKKTQNYRAWSDFPGFLTPPALVNYSKFVAFAVTGRKTPQKWTLATNFLSSGTASVPPPLNFNSMGMSKDMFKKSFDSRAQAYEVQTFSGQDIFRRYRYNYGELLTSYFTNTQTESDIYTAQLTLPAAAIITTGPAGGSSFSMFKAENMTVTSEFYVLAAAPGKAVMAVFQDWVTSSFEVAGVSQGSNFQYVDPVKQVSKPASANTYLQNGASTPTPWAVWRDFNGTTPWPIDDGAGVGGSVRTLSLGEAGTGILRANTVYEFSFSIYDKSTSHETNVGEPALVLTDVNDYVRLLLYRYTPTTPTACERVPGGDVLNPLYVSALNSLQTDFINRINFVQYRIYFRERGTFEWLPAAYIDAPKLFDGMEPEIILCEGPFAGSVGGQPGGFNDYSSLPDDAYFDVIQFRERMFWMSAKNLMFSRTQDYFSYPVTNAIACPDGSFKGMMSHAYPGQAQQDSRLVIFTTGQIAIGRFQGQDYATIQTVRVSSVASADLPVDGSDFTVNTWTTQTAFSSRSAVVAQGILYYWGPTGIYRDMGAELPTKEWSELIEPYLFTLYDTQRTDEIHSVYNDMTKEIIWFYPRNPKLGGGQGALTYKVTWATFHVWSMDGIIIDSAQVVPARFDNATSKGNSGNRIMLSIRNASSGDQRAVFFDDLCDSGDLTNGNTLLVKTVSVQGANRRLTFAARAPGGATIPTTGSLTLSGYRDYRDVLTPNPDAIYPIVGSDGSTYVDIGPVTGVTFPTTETISDPSRFFPVTIESLNGFTFSARSCYWAPRGMRSWQRWLYCYQSYKANLLLPSGGQSVRLKFYSILGTGNSQRDIVLADNSRGNMQAHSQIVFAQQNAEGPALSIELTTPSGKFCGSRWYCQYLSFDLTPMEMNNFKTWEA